MRERTTTLRCLAAIQAFENYPGAVIIANLQSINLDNAAARGEFECSCCWSFGCSNVLSGNLAKCTPKGEGCDSLDESPETGEKTIKSKFLEAQVNIVAEQSGKSARERIHFVKAPKQMNESYSMIKHLPKPEMKCDKDLNGRDQTQSAEVAEFFKGCVSSSSLDSQYKVWSRPESEGVSQEVVAGIGRGSGHTSVGALEGPSHSSSNPEPRHTALIELCCGPKSFIGEQARRKELGVLRVTRDSHDLSTQEGRRAVQGDVCEIVQSNKVHLWASLPCKPWSQLAELNRRKLGKKFHERLESQREESMIFIGVFIEVAKYVLENGGGVSFGWPAHSIGWHIPALASFFQSEGFENCVCHGCAMGLQHRGHLITKTLAHR